MVKTIKEIIGMVILVVAALDCFGEPGAITVINRHQQEFFMESITIEGFACGPVHFPCNSWVQSNKDLPGKRIFFSNKVIFNF